MSDYEIPIVEPVEVQIELGSLFAVVKASFIGVQSDADGVEQTGILGWGGAHVDLDGNVLGNLDVRAVYATGIANSAWDFEVAKNRALRAWANTAIRKAAIEIGLDPGEVVQANLAAVIKATPLTREVEA